MYFKTSRTKIAWFLLGLTTVQTLCPLVAYGLTSGPSQPEVQSFEPAGTTEMVDVFSGDFTYNIPLFELPGPNGGYPFNLAYHAGIGMEQEASWTGVGWSLNPGSVSRQMRGLPDEFNGDALETKTSMKPNVTVGLGAGANVEIVGADPLKASVGFSVYNNNYKGVGYSLDASLGFSAATSSGHTAGIGLGVNLDSQEGIDLNPTLSSSSKLGDFTLGVGYNSRQGLKAMTFNANALYARANNVLVKLGNTYSLSLHNPGFTPQVGMPFKNLNLAAEFKLGGAAYGVFGSPYVRGFYNEQQLKNDNKWVSTPTYGYLNYQNTAEAHALQDFNREMDGMVRKETPNLPIPALSYDIYSLTGQGVAAMYRPMRTDYGVVRDPRTESTSVGGNVGGDVGPALAHVGVNLGINHSKSVSGAWSEKNEIGNSFQFQSQQLNSAYEPWYFKVHGEASARPADPVTALGGDNAVRVALGSGNNPPAIQTLERRSWANAAPNTTVTNRERQARSEMITTFNNAQLLQGAQEAVNLFKVTYLDTDGQLKPYSRSAFPRHHTAGMTALNADGLRYTYAIPAYNHRQEEVQFSCRQPANNATLVETTGGDNADPAYRHSGTDEYLNRTKMPAFAHSYLLTSIVGPDYVDVTGNGVSTDDLGYWVKFTYKQTNNVNDPYKWRAPFYGALYNDGLRTDAMDDRGSFVYGEKDIWYLARAETKSHIAVFETQAREDSYGAASKMPASGQLGKPLYALKEVRLYTRNAYAAVNSRPLKKVVFDYDYSLCQKLPNSANQRGKLTLKKLWFEYGISARGSLNPYRFTYHAHNPDYDMDALDRWGVYKKYPEGNPRYNKEFPYALQDPARKAEIDRNAAAWSLTEISLPSGGKIKVDYESDDYAYVQQRPAMQMMPLVDPYTASSATLPGRFLLQDNNLKVRFKLEKPIAGNLSTEAARKEVMKYLDMERKQLYFKIKVNLRSAGENAFEYISGYVNINTAAGTMGLEKDASDQYAYGYFTVVAEKGLHPFMLRAWQHLRINQPLLASVAEPVRITNDRGQRVGSIRGMASVAPQIKQMFSGFNNYCRRKGWGKEVDVSGAWIRLNSPDGVKYGGGLRVKQITLFDQWQHDGEGIYGQTYDYTTQDENGQMISSGVATYEPFAGGEENALRFAKEYAQKVPLATNNNFMIELPVNEGYFPGASVGYRKVTVKSLASASLAGQRITLPEGVTLFPQGTGISYGTSGVTVHEFYTAKDFPVLVDETEKKQEPFKLFFPIPFLGSVSETNLTATQGYSIVTNDMHGKPKKIAYYRQDKAGRREPAPISWVQYNYMAQQKVYDGRTIQTLDNTFKESDDYTIEKASAADRANPAVRKYHIGQETEFFTDMREHEDKTWAGGVNTNVDLFFFLFVTIPVFTVWPNASKQSSRLRTVVTNKVIFKTGVLESVEAYDGGSRVKTENLKWDKLTGRPVLIRVNNNFDAPVYTYHQPAYRQYAGMGPAYLNTGLQYRLLNVHLASYTTDQYRFTVPTGVDPYLQAGDELILYNQAGEVTGKGIYVGREQGWHTLYSEETLNRQEYTGLIYRSGYRNQLQVDAGTVTALRDPSVPVTTKSYSRTLQIPVRGQRQ